MKTKILLTLLCISVSALQAAELTADEIVSKANQASYYAGDDGQATVSMKLSDGRSREMTILRKNIMGGDKQYFYIYFKSPSDVRKMTYLVHKNPKGNDARWLFLPALNLVKQIAPGDKRTSFAGGDFLYEDVSGRGLLEDTHELVETSETQYVINNVPVDSKSVEFGSYKVWIDKETFLPRKAEYLNKNGKLYRVVEATKVEMIQGFPTVLESTAKNLETGSSTVNTFSNIKYNIGLKDNIFTERFLRRPPRQVTR